MSFASCATESLTIRGHADSLYNGLYCREEDWNGHPHFESQNGMHLFYYDTGWDYGEYWQLDDRDQDGTSDYYNGGYYPSSTDDYIALEAASWDSLTIQYNPDEVELGEHDWDRDAMEAVCFDLTGNDIAMYNTRYC